MWQYIDTTSSDRIRDWKAVLTALDENTRVLSLFLDSRLLEDSKKLMQSPPSLISSARKYSRKKKPYDSRPLAAWTVLPDGMCRSADAPCVCVRDIYVCTYLWMCACVYIDTYLYVCVSVCVCMYVCISMFMH